jgi:hypothetical protein
MRVLDKKIITRTDLKVAGFSNFRFYKNKSVGKIFLDADYVLDVKASKYKVSITVEADDERTSHRSIGMLCRLMLLKSCELKEMKVAELRNFAEDHGDKLD